MRSRLSLIFLLVLFLSSCGLSWTEHSSAILPTVTRPLDPTMTMTPFLPEGQIHQISPTAILVPDSDQDSPIEETGHTHKGQVRILLLGSDQRPGHADFRTDVFVLLTIQGDGSVSLISFPRDLYVEIPGVGKDRINTAYEYGGFALVSNTLEDNFGVRPDHFVLTNFTGFMYIINSLGGIDVQAALPLYDTRDGFPNGFSVNSGVVHMDGETALWYVRSRKTTTDFDRLRRAQEVLVAIGLKIFSVQGLARIPELFQVYQSSVVTDLTVESVLGMLPFLQAVDQDNMDLYSISPPLVTAWTDPESGAYLLIPDLPGIRHLIKQVLGIKE